MLCQGKEKLADAQKRLIAGDSRSDHIVLSNAFAVRVGSVHQR